METEPITQPEATTRLVEITDMTFRLDVFEGPLDLLLHLISRNKVSIDDIPIALILDQYLSYLEAMKSLDMEVTSDFIVMAAQLILIKSRMVLPRPEEPDAEDPRKELVRRLEEYQLFKQAAGWLTQRADKVGELVTKDAEPLPGKPEYKRRHEQAELLAALLTMAASKELPSREIPQVFSELVGRESETIEDATERVKALLKDQCRASILEILVSAGNRRAAIATFLALLEMCRDKVIHIDESDCAALGPAEEPAGDAPETEA